jgi:hypothetical protein
LSYSSRLVCNFPYSYKTFDSISLYLCLTRSLARYYNKRLYSFFFSRLISISSWSCCVRASVCSFFCLICWTWDSSIYTAKFFLSDRPFSLSFSISCLCSSESEIYERIWLLFKTMLFSLACRSEFFSILCWISSSWSFWIRSLIFCSFNFYSKIFSLIFLFFKSLSTVITSCLQFKLPGFGSQTKELSASSNRRLIWWFRLISANVTGIWNDAALIFCSLIVTVYILA